MNTKTQEAADIGTIEENETGKATLIFTSVKAALKMKDAYLRQHNVLIVQGSGVRLGLTQAIFLGIQ